MNFVFCAIMFWSAYILVTLVGVGHTVFNWKVLKMGIEKEKPTSMYDIVPYAKTVPYHPLYNIVIWPFFAFLYLQRLNPIDIWEAAFWLGLAWITITIVFDLFGWVLIKHPWRMTFKEMYLDYQPWISLIYLAVFAGPFIAVLFL